MYVRLLKKRMLQGIRFKTCANRVRIEWLSAMVIMIGVVSSEKLELTCKRAGCGREFKSKKQLTAHVHVHTGTYACVSCSAVFTQRCDLVAHQETHNNQKRWQCDKCGRFYSTSKILRRHVEDSHEKKKHRCKTCKKMFGTNSGLLKHLKNKGHEKE